MRLTDFLYFLRQILFPAWKPKQEAEQEYDDEPSRFTLFAEWVSKKLRSRESVGTTVSLFFHAVLIFLLAWLVLPTPKEWGGISLTSSPNVEEALKDVQEAAKGEADLPEINMPAQDSAAPQERNVEIAQVQPEEPMATDSESDAAQDVATDSATTAETGTPEKKTGDFTAGGGYEGRTPEGRGKAIGDGDSSARGEDAVEKGLIWIVAHQMPDGGWSFDFDRSCKSCSKSGVHGSRLAATALALLPFLGAGYTHETGPYRRQVENGLAYLIEASIRDRRGRDFQYGSSGDGMYAQGIAAMTLCEAHAMSRTKRRKLQETAQEALRFIEEAQDRRGGGWRYKPNESPGDLSVTTWQLMALKSGRLGGLQVSQPVLYNAVLFLDTVETDGGRQYRYVPTEGRQGIGPESSINCSATGLLLRMYLGWEPGEGPLDEGIERVTEYSPIRIRKIETEPDNKGKRNTQEVTVCNLYYAYYSTLALHHYGGSHWRSWNSEIREFLIQTQSNRGHEAGSWFFADHYCDKGGRLLNTVLAVLVLETPYRIMPLFRKSGR